MRGFTLFEVMISISLLGVLFLLVSSAFFSANRMVGSTERYALRVDEIRASQHFLREALQGVRAIFWPVEMGENGKVFEGDFHRIRFAAPAPASVGERLKIYQLESSKIGISEFQLQISFFELDSLKPWGKTQVLMRDLRQVQLSYSGLDERNTNTGWLAKWPWPERLPQFVRIEIEVDGPVPWPSMTVALRSGIPPTSVR
ncbi:prepilin-type N-terminal cleavage/methylation domain-containing protein [Pseudomonas sp. 1912-s]|uniref:prepilin-type N-terminal cleavage/methylation domain-containing protein n=1 Tax=Pseudomonas sp. 1912-s TaxID=3033802 RepID=UPI0023DF53D2|nr:prepilin-type N-terminal cleavage/methylation domain-containing protein [Pseudomonas sp. 1912-s]MDF3202954.1 prepilin-type N-terminal cleavage/methylation domain-containing protein [Pseudomonas sp. 1912-s]